MSVTVVTRRRARPGFAEALFELASRRMTEMGSGRQARQQSLLFQGVDDDHLLLRVGHWDSSEAYWAAMQGLGGFGALDALCEGPGERFFFQRLSLYEDMSRRPRAIDCAVIQTPANGAVEYEQVLQRNVPQVRRQPGLLLNAFYQDLDDRSRYFVMQGWDSAEAQRLFLAETASELEAPLRAMGVQLERYAVHTRVEVDRYSARTAGASAPGQPADRPDPARSPS